MNTTEQTLAHARSALLMAKGALGSEKNIYVLNEAIADIDEALIMGKSLRLWMSISITPAMIKAVRQHPTTAVDDREEWYSRLGWLISAYDVLVSMHLLDAPPSTDPK